MTSRLLHTLLIESAERHPDRKAIIFKDTSLTYAELDLRSTRLAAELLGQGVKQGDRVGIMLPKSVEAVVSLFGILRAGAVYVPLDPAAPVPRLNQIIAQCGIECLISSYANLMKLYSGPDLPRIGKAIVAGPQPGDSPVRSIAWNTMGQAGCAVSPDPSETRPAYILHTSGSTGRPKGVVISHRNARAFVDMAADFFQVNAGDRVASHAPLHFDLSVFDIFTAIRKSATLVLVPESLSVFPARLAEWIDREQITVWNSVSSVLTMLADRGRIDQFGFENLRLVHFSGDVMPVKYLRILKQQMRHARFFNIYGQTEANSSLFYPIEQIPDLPAWTIPIGKPLPGFEVFALNEGGAVISRPGEEGELYVRADTVAIGYWNEEAMTREKFVPDPREKGTGDTVYKTGDIVRMDADGNYLFVGRRDHMIKSRGYRIELNEIEAALASHPSVSQAVVIAVPNELIGNSIIAYIALRKDANVPTEELEAYCHSLLPRYMVPEQILFVDTVSRTSTGKADRRLLIENYLSLQKQNAAFLQPSPPPTSPVPPSPVAPPQKSA